MANQYSSLMPASPEEMEKRRFEVMKLRRIGTTWEEIAEKIGEMFNRPISYQQCAEDFRIIMKARAAELHEETDAIRNSQIHRLSVAINRVWKRIDAENPSLEHVEILIKLETRMSRLLGTDAPVKSEVNDARKPVQLTEAQIKDKIAEIYGRLKQKQELPPVPVVTEIAAKDGEIILQHITSATEEVVLEQANERPGEDNDEADEEEAHGSS